MRIMTTLDLITASDLLWVTSSLCGMAVNWPVMHESMMQLRQIRHEGIDGLFQRDAESEFWSDVSLTAIPTLALLAGIVRPFVSLEVRALISGVLISAICALVVVVGVRSMWLRRAHLEDIRARKRGQKKTRGADHC
jgi:hypothetical protein